MKLRAGIDMQAKQSSDYAIICRDKHITTRLLKQTCSNLPYQACVNGIFQKRAYPQTRSLQHHPKFDSAFAMLQALKLQEKGCKNRPLFVGWGRLG